MEGKEKKRNQQRLRMMKKDIGRKILILYLKINWLKLFISKVFQ